MANLAVFDAVVLIAYLVGVVALGIWLGRGQQNARDYLLGGNNAPWWAILGSIVATETSTVTFLSVPGIAYAKDGDLRFLQLAIGYIVGRSLIVVWLLPLYFRGELFTAYELLQKRFGVATQKLASLLFLVTRNLGDGLRLFLTAVVLEATMGWPLPVCVIVIGIATIIFTVLGGMKSVIWNDCLQLVVYMVGGILALGLIVGRLDGGVGELLEFAAETERLRMFDFATQDAVGNWRFDEVYTFWAGLIGGMFLTLGTHGADQMLVQRVLASRSRRDAAWAMVGSGFVVYLQFALFLFVGIALAAFYHANPPATEFQSTDRVFSTYIVQELPTGIGVIGLLLAAVFSAAISTLSSSLNSSATAVITDWIPKRHDVDSDRRSVWQGRVLTVVFGVIQIIVGIAARNFDQAVIGNALAIAGFSAGLLLGLFALGSFIPSVNQTGAVIALLTGTCVLLVVKFGISYPIAWPWLPVIGATSTFLTGWICSRLIRNQNTVLHDSRQ